LIRLGLILFLRQSLNGCGERAGDGGDGGESHQEAFHVFRFLHAGSPAARSDHLRLAMNPV
jgi:hypothetical protein